MMVVRYYMISVFVLNAELSTINCGTPVYTEYVLSLSIQGPQGDILLKIKSNTLKIDLAILLTNLSEK